MAKEKMINIILFFFLDLLSSVTYGIKMNRRKIPCYVLETVLQHSVWRMLRAKLPLLKRLFDVESIQKMVVSTCLPCGLVKDLENSTLRTLFLFHSRNQHYQLHGLPEIPPNLSFHKQLGVNITLVHIKYRKLIIVCPI